jgi:type II secretory pathway pseudopilin PulG
MLQYLVNNRYNRTWATMIELMAMISILGLWVSAMFSVVTSGIYFAKDTEDTVKAINLAREWVEGVINLRNTNWLRFSSDRTNCWKVKEYAWTSCIWVNLTNVSPFLINTGSHTLYTSNWLWYLSWSSVSDFDTNWPTYSSTFAVYQDDRGFFTQTGTTALPRCDVVVQKNCKTIFTRELIVSLPDASNLDTLYIKSIVRWNTKRKQKIELSSTVTNWKAKF